MSGRPVKRGLAVAAPSGSVRRGAPPEKRAASSSISGCAHVADVNPAFTIAATVRCAETVNDRLAWTAEGDGSLCVRSLPKGTELKSLPGRPGGAACTALLYIDGLQAMWAGFSDGYVRVYSAVRAEVEVEFAATATPRAAAVTAMLEVEGVVCVAGADGSLTQWDCHSCTCVRTLPRQRSAILCLGCYAGPTGSVVFAGCESGSVTAWDPYLVDGQPDGGASDALMHVFPSETAGPTRTPSPVRAIEVVHHASLMWTGSDDGIVRVWNLESLELVGRLRGHKAAVTSLLSVESRMWSGDAAGQLLLWDMNSLTMLQELAHRTESGAVGATLTMRRMLPSTLWKIWTASASGVVQCWNAETVPILFQNKRTNPTGENDKAEADEDEDVAAWHTLQRSGTAIAANGGARAEGGRLTLGAVDVQRLADQMGYERGRMEVQRELQTQQLLEEENAELRRRLREVLQTRGASLAAEAVVHPHPAAAAASTTPSSPLDDAVTTRLTRRFSGENWGYLMLEKPHQLKEEFREEACTALGVPGSQIVRVDLAEGSLVAHVEVRHHRGLSPVELERRLLSYPFELLLQLHDRAHTAPKCGLDAAEETILTLERRLQATSASSSSARESQGPMPPTLHSHGRHGAGDAAAAAAELAAKDREIAALRAALTDLGEQLHTVRDSGTPLDQAIGHDSSSSGGAGLHRSWNAHAARAGSSLASPSEERSPSPPAVERTSKKAARPYALDKSTAPDDADDGDDGGPLVNVSPWHESIRAARSLTGVHEVARGGSPAVESAVRGGAAAAEDTAVLRRELLKSQGDAAAKGAALRKLQHELLVLQRAMEGEVGGRGVSQGDGEVGEAAPAERATAVAVPAGREVAAKEAALAQLRSEHAALRTVLAEREEQLRHAQEKSAALRDALGRNDEAAQDQRLREEKLHEACNALRVELERERAQRLRAESLLSDGHTQSNGAEENGEGHGLEARNLALSVRLADAESVLAELQALLEQTSAELHDQRRETERLQRLLAGHEEGSDGH